MDDCLVLLSLALTAATFFPQLSTATIEIGFAVGAARFATGRTPDFASLARPPMSPIRRAGLFTLRGYLLVAVALVVVKVVQAGMSG